jgi:hypothetical protein
VAYPIKGTELYQEVEALQTERLDWATSTDRNIDFRRTYSRRYYDFAVVRVVNEVNAHKSAAQKRYLNTARFKLKSTVAKVGMWWNRAEKE